jgi:hypothetical protein
VPLSDYLLVEDAYLLHHEEPHVLHDVSCQLLLGDVLTFYVEPEVLPLEAASVGEVHSKSNFTLLCVACSSPIDRLHSHNILRYSPECVEEEFSVVRQATAALQQMSSRLRRDGSARERGPYWYFQFHEGGKRKKLYLGKTSDPEGILVAKRAKPLGE